MSNSANTGRVVDLTGRPGKSPYQYAVAGGYTGTEEEFQAALASGPWLPAKDNVVINDLRIGSLYRAGKLVLDAPSAKDPQNPIEPGKEAALYAESSSPIDLSVLDRMGNRSLLIRGCTTFFCSGARLESVNDPINDHDAATKKYVDDMVQSVSVNKHIFIVPGPIAVDETFDLSFSGLKTNPYEGNTIFFGEPMKFRMFPSELVKKFQFEVINGWGYGGVDVGGSGLGFNQKSYRGTITAKALTEIPEGSSVRILWVWL